MTSSADAPAISFLDVTIPIGLKRTRAPPEYEVASALNNNSNLSRISIVALPNKKDKKRRLNCCSILADWLEQHGSQLTELVLSMDEADEVQLVSALFKCPGLQLTKLQVSAADFPQEFLQKLPNTLQIFSGHLGAHGKLEPFAALTHLHSLAVRCYPTQRWEGHESTAGFPLALLYHPALQCLIIDASSFVYIGDEDAVCDGPESKLKVVAITGNVSSADVKTLIAKAPQLQHLCLRISPLSQMYSMGGVSSADSGPLSLDLGKLTDLRALELGFPHLKVSCSGLQKLQKLSAVLLCGQFGAQKPALPKALAEEPDELAPELLAGQMIARTATVAGSNKKYKLTVAMSLQHRSLIIEPKWVAELSESIITAV